ncbi:hypothetical protein [Sorangium sp. So ce887]|uniref:hypothetical protein n=1 Tax=Sorangium sp. So ce887 TaxID=3133324 RepID=UPI003F5DAA7B
MRTTVRLDFSELGRCLHLVLGQNAGSQRSWSRVVVEAELVLDESTRRPGRDRLLACSPGHGGGETLVDPRGRVDRD